MDSKHSRYWLNFLFLNAMAHEISPMLNAISNCQKHFSPNESKKQTNRQTQLKSMFLFSSCISDIQNTRWIILMIIIYEMNWNCIEFSVCVAKLKGKIFTKTFNNNYGVDCVIWVIGCVGCNNIENNKKVMS